MGFFKNIIKGTINTALLPIDMIIDTSGATMFSDEFRTTKRARKIKEDFEDAYDDLEDWLND